MERRDITALDAPAPAGGHPQAVEVRQAARALYFSGQIPVAADGTVPPDFRAQCRLAWAHVEAQLRAADTPPDHLKVTTCLSDRRHAVGRPQGPAGGSRRPLPRPGGRHRRLFDEAWQLEIIEVITAA